MEHFAKRKSSYLLLRSEQLVGAALIVVVKDDLAKSIRSVEATTKKVSHVLCILLPSLSCRLVYLASAVTRAVLGSDLTCTIPQYA
jgi:hypothetical protein